MFRRPFSTALVTVGTGSVIALGASPASAAGWVYQQTDRDACYDAVSMDSDNNGRINVVWFDLDNDCVFDTAMWDTNGNDALLERASYDMNENGRTEALMVDTDQRVGYDWVYVDLNEDGYWDQRAALATTIIGSTTVGGTATYGGVPGLLTTMARIGGVVAW